MEGNNPEPVNNPDPQLEEAIALPTDAQARGISRALASFNFGGLFSRAATMADRLMKADSKGKRIIDDELSHIEKPSMQAMMDSAFRVAERLLFDDEKKEETPVSQPKLMICDDGEETRIVNSIADSILKESGTHDGKKIAAILDDTISRLQKEIKKVILHRLETQNDDHHETEDDRKVIERVIHEFSSSVNWKSEKKIAEPDNKTKFELKEIINQPSPVSHLKLPDLQNAIRNRALSKLAEELSNAQVLSKLKESSPENKYLDPLQLREFIIALEEEIFNQHKTDYGRFIGVRILLLKNKENQNLKLDLLNGKLSIKDFATIPAEEFEENGRDKQAKEGLKWQMQALQSDYLDKNTEVEDCEFECRECKSKKVTIHQMQVREADEPTTTFFQCTYCLHRWKANN